MGFASDDLHELKKKLRSYSEEDIIFNEPHFSQQLALREGSRRDVISNLLDPEKLVYSYVEEGMQGDPVHCLHFRISNTRTLRLPVIFDFRGGKNLYILTYIMRYRSWKSMVRR